MILGGGYKLLNTENLLTFDGDFTDIGNNPVVWNISGPGHVNISYGYKKFGTGSALFNNITARRNSYIMSDRGIDCLKNGTEWTIDWWEYRISSTNNYPVTFEIGRHGYYDTDETSVINHRGNQTRFYSALSSDLPLYGSTPNILDPSITLNVWNHMAVCRKNSTFYLFKNGQLQNSLTGTLNLSNHDFFAIGQNILNPNRTDQLGYQFNGCIDMFRISSVCLWTTNFNHNKIQY